MNPSNRPRDPRLVPGRSASMPIPNTAFGQTTQTRPPQPPGSRVVEVLSSDDDEEPDPNATVDPQHTNTRNNNGVLKTTIPKGRKPYRRFATNTHPSIPDHTGPPGRVRFPAEMPASLRPLFLAFFRAQNSNIVPRAIYFMQVPWIFKLHDGRRKRDCTDANYFRIDAVSGGFAKEPVREVRVLSLPWMARQHGGKNAQRCIMVRDEGLEGGEWVVLARNGGMKNEFRVWRGLDDDEFEGACVVKRGVAGGQVGEMLRRERRAGVRRELGNEERRESRWALGSYRAAAAGRKKGRRDAQRERERETVREIVEIEDSDDEEIEEVERVPPALMPGSVGRGELPLVPERPQQLQLASTTNPRTPQDFDHSDDDGVIIDLSREVHFYFHGPAFRERALFFCGNFGTFFGNAVASGLVTAQDKFPVLKCMVGRTAGGIGPPWLIADEQDFTEFVRAVMGMAGIGDIVHVTK